MHDARLICTTPMGDMTCELFGCPLDWDADLDAYVHVPQASDAEACPQHDDRPKTVDEIREAEYTALARWHEANAALVQAQAAFNDADEAYGEASRAYNRAVAAKENAR